MTVRWPERGTVAIPRGERVALRLLVVGAAVAGGVNLVTAIGNAISASLGNRVDVLLLSGDERPGSGIVDRVAFPEALVTADLSDGVRILLATSELLGSLTFCAVAASLALLFLRMLQGRAFVRSTTNAAYFAGGALAVGGLLSQLAGGFGRMIAADEVQADAGAFLQVAFLVDGTPILVGFAVLGTGFILEWGQRMHARIAELEHETKGLV